MTNYLRYAAAAVLSLGLQEPVAAGEAKQKLDVWNVQQPFPQRAGAAVIDTDEGSWMDVDVSPDGQTIAFSLLGDIYAMPIGGGTPTRLAEGVAWEVQPRFSPDGKAIAFTSDRGGGDNVWIMAADGTGKRQVTKESFRTVNEPSWSPDGRFIAVRKHFTTSRSLGTGEIWVYGASGGAGMPVVRRPNERHQKELGEPVFSPDGRSLLLSRDATPGGVFEYAQDSGAGVFEIDRLDLATGERTVLAGGPGGAARPTPSPDGRSLAFVGRRSGRTVLVVKDMASGREREVHALDRDMQENWAVSGVYPNLAWTPDGHSLVFWAGGRIQRVDADGTNARVIPFRVRDQRAVFKAPHPRTAVAPTTFATKMVRFAAASSDGRTVAFESLGRIYLKRGDGEPTPLTNSDRRELHPSFSRSGDKLVYVDWSDADLGRVMIADLSNGTTRPVTTVAGHYALPRFSPDGSTVVFEKRAAGRLTDPAGSMEPGVYAVPAAGGVPRRIIGDHSKPHFAAGSERLFMLGREQGEPALVSTDLTGGSRRVHARGALVSDMEVDPTGRLVMFQENYRAHVAELPPGPEALSLSSDMTAVPAYAATDEWTAFPTWTPDGSALVWTQGPDFKMRARGELLRNLGAARAAVVTTPLGRALASARPSGRVALVGARLITMAGRDGGIVEDGVVVIEGDRIVRVGSKAEVSVPPDARILKLDGRTVIPGIIDAHAHGPAGEDGLIPEQNWSYVQALALGVTTIHDPANSSSDIFAAAELQRAGLLLAPRIFSSGDTVYGAKAPDSYARIDRFEDALVHVRRLKAEGALSVKNYNQPRREQRQQIIEAARRENVMVVAEGGAQFGLGMTHVLDGNSTLEHNIPLERFYSDVLQVFKQGDTNNTPTLVVTFGGLAGDPYWQQATDLMAQPLLRAHTPPALLRAAGARRVKAPEDYFVDDEAAREAKRLADLGVKVSIGGHGQQAGISPHWDIWSFVRGGMSNVEALAAATIQPARSLGMEADIGSIEPGKLADLVVLDADPTVDIRNTEKVRSVVLGGRVYDAATMDEIAPTVRHRPPHWWAEPSHPAPNSGIE